MASGVSWYGNDEASTAMRKGPPSTLGTILVFDHGNVVEARWQRPDGVWHSFSDYDPNTAIAGLIKYVAEQWPQYPVTQADAQAETGIAK